MFSPFPLIGTAWTFMQKHTVLRTIGFWLLILPMFVINLLTRFVLPPSVATPNGTPLTAIVLLMFAIGILTVWGEACVLVVGKRLLQHNAGRTRTSLRSVARQGSRFIVPLLLTGLLRGCFTLLWMLLLIIPGIIYSLSTSFYPIIVVCTGKSYRPALQASKAVLRGQWSRSILSLIALAITTFLPLAVLSAILEIFAQSPMINVAIDLIDSVLLGIGTILFTLGMIVLYGRLKKSAKNA